LPVSFGREEIIVAATQAVGIIPANGRPSFIDGATPGLLIQKLTNLFEDVVFLMTKYRAVN